MRIKTGIWSRLVLLVLLVLTMHVSMGAGGCGEFAEGVNDLNAFCKAVGEKCTAQTSADCVQKLGGDNAVLKSTPDYKGAKACVDQLSTCSSLPDNCWFFAVERFKTATQETPPDAGSIQD